ncbi:MAG: insulinase family protein [Spirochaetales bacterium]|nr:MAG: insulinase family protein [Spirochaetales bacterium]
MMKGITAMNYRDRCHRALTAPTAVLLAVLAASCAGSPAVGPLVVATSAPVTAVAQPVDIYADWSLPTESVSVWTMPDKPGSYMQANLAAIETRTLSNGVTLIIKKNPANRVFSLKVAFKGGVALTPTGKAGIEAMTLALMARGSQKYSYQDLQRIQYEKSSSIGYTSAGYDWSSFDLNTIDKYWDEMFAIFADCVLRPAFDSSQFNLVQNDFRVIVQKSLADPYNYAVSKLHEKIFVGHPYEEDFAGTPASISAMTLADLIEYYTTTMSADRMAVVAVGNFDADKLTAALNATIGTIPRRAIAVPSVPRREAKPAVYLEKFDKSKGIAYVRGDYPIADIKSPDFPTLQLAYSMLNELLFSIVRTDHGACYSTWANAHGFLDSYGSLVVYKTDQPGAVKGWLDESIALLASGKTLNLKGGDQKYAPIAQTIEAYKAKYVNAFYGNQQTNAEMAAQLASSLVYFGDAVEYLKFIDKIQAISAEDVVAAVKAYVVAAPVSWIVVGDAAMLNKVDKAAYLGFTGTVE